MFALCALLTSRTKGLRGRSHGDVRGAFQWYTKGAKRGSAEAQCVRPVPVQMWAGVSPVPAQMWAGVSPVPAQMWAGVSPVPAQMWRRRMPRG